MSREFQKLEQRGIIVTYWPERWLWKKDHSPEALISQYKAVALGLLAYYAPCHNIHTLISLIRKIYITPCARLSLWEQGFRPFTLQLYSLLN